MRIIKRIVLYGSLIFLAAVLVGLGFHTAEKGVQALTGADGPPKTISVRTDQDAVQVTVMGKKVVQPKPSLGDQWSRSLEANTSGLGSLADGFAYKTGILLQKIAQLTIEWLAAIAGTILQAAMAFF